MTALELLTGISAALLLQISVASLVAFARRPRSYPATTKHDGVTKETLAAWAGWRDFRVTRRVYEDLAETQCSFYIAPVDGLALPAYKPGQYLTFSIPARRPTADGSQAVRAVTRCYSLSDRPDPAAYRVTVKRILAPREVPDAPEGLSSSHFHRNLHLGDVVRVRAPSGHFFVTPDPAESIVLIAGGIGITPLMAMLRWVTAEQPARAVHLYYGIRSANECVFEDALVELARTHPSFHLVLVRSEPADPSSAVGAYVRFGYIDVALLKETLPAGRHGFYVCGPPPMMASLIPALRQWGVATEDLHFESFGPASIRIEADVAAIETRAHHAIGFQSSGRTLDWDGRDGNLLDFAERHGIAVESGCRSGSCGACQTGLVSGTVRYDHTPDHDIAPHHCLLCVGVPEDDLVLAA